MTGRVPAVAALIAAAVAVLVIVSGAGGSYVLRAQFTDGSQLVRGGVVQVSGRRVGTIERIALTDDSLAEVTMKLTDGEVNPLHQGTRATIRTVGLSGVTNRYIDLVPGPDTAPVLPDGGVLPTTQTHGVVDLDAVLNTLDPAVRADVQGVIGDAARALTPEAAGEVNAGLEMLNPAASQVARLGKQLTRDEVALAGLLEHSGAVAEVLARHRDRLQAGIGGTAGVLGTLASRREELAESLDRSPAAMRAATATLARVRTRTLPLLEPTLREALPTMAPLDQLLRTLAPTLTDSRPLLDALRRLMPQARAALEPLPGLEGSARPAMASITRALRESQPVVSGLRPYTPDLVAGFFSGFGGSTAHSYDANGHFARIMLGVGSQTAVGTLPNPSGDNLAGYRTRMDARCPGGAEEPAPDGSNPWAQPGACAREDTP
jgi:phospholipid/cholesterol/gamma-HCH transport system substrate-binding protein